MWGVGCARLRRAGEGAGARESGEQRSGEARQRGEGSRERQHRRWYCIALWESRLPPLSETPRIYTPRALFADTTLVHVTKPRFGSKYSGVLRSPQELKIIGDPAQMKFVLCRWAREASSPPPATTIFLHVRLFFLSFRFAPRKFSGEKNLSSFFSFSSLLFACSVVLFASPIG